MTMDRLASISKTSDEREIDEREKKEGREEEEKGEEEGDGSVFEASVPKVRRSPDPYT